MENNIKKHIEEICVKASKASKSLFHASSETKNLALKKIILMELYWIDYSSTNPE